MDKEQLTYFLRKVHEVINISSHLVREGDLDESSLVAVRGLLAQTEVCLAVINAKIEGLR